MTDVAMFRFDSLPGVVFTVTRSTEAVPTQSGRVAATIPAGFLDCVGRRESPEVISQSGFIGPVGPEPVDTPRIWGGKVPFTFRTLPGFTFYALRFDHEVIDENGPGGPSRRTPGWIRITYYGPGDDEERELVGFAGP